MSDVNDIIIATIVATPPTIVAFANLLVNKKISKSLTRDIREVHLSVNSRMDELLETTRTDSKAKGKVEERKETLIRNKKEKK